MASSPPVIARPEGQGAANGELSPAKPPHPAVEASAAAQSVIEGEQHGLQEGGNPSPTAAVAGAAPGTYTKRPSPFRCLYRSTSALPALLLPTTGHLATPSVTREPHSQAEATTPRHHAVVVAAAPGASSAGSTPRGAVVSGPGRGRQAASGMLYEGSPLHGASRSSRAPGLQTFGSQYMPFAAGGWGYQRSVCGRRVLSSHVRVTLALTNKRLGGAWGCCEQVIAGWQPACS
jgi:hypothetical protein